MTARWELGDQVRFAGCALLTSAVLLTGCGHSGQQPWPHPPAVTRSSSREPSRWERFAPPIYGPCDERNGPCPPPVLRVELRWDTPGTDLDLHGALTQWGLTDRVWFTVADSHWQIPEPRLMFAGTHRLLNDSTDASEAPEVIEARTTGASGDLTIAVHFHSDMRRVGHSVATVDFICDRHRYARVTRTLESGTQGERSNDFWRVANVRMSQPMGCVVTPIDIVTPTAEIDHWHFSSTRPPE